MENNIEKVSLWFIHLHSFHRIVKNFQKSLTPVNFLNFSKKAQKRSYCSKNVFVIKI